MLSKNLEKLSSKDKITIRLDKLANLYNKTKNEHYKLEWNNIINLYFYKKKSSNM